MQQQTESSYNFQKKPTINSSADQLLTIADIARQLDIPESTCRYYCKRFANFIPCVGDGRRRRYRIGTIDVLNVILDEMKKSRTTSSVDDVLASKFPRNAVSLRDESRLTSGSDRPNTEFSFPTSALEYMERQTIALESIAQVLGLLGEKLLISKKHTSEGEISNIEELKQEIKNLKILLEASEKTQQADLDQLRSWMAKVIQKKAAHA